MILRQPLIALSTPINTLPVCRHTDLDVDGAREDENDSDDESFHYPGTPNSSATPVTAPPASIRSYHTDYFSLTRSSSSRPVDLTPSLSQATEFRVPTHDAPQKVTLPRPNAPVPHAMHSQWERDSSATECRSCHKRFTFYFRKVSLNKRRRRPFFNLLFNFC